MKSSQETIKAVEAFKLNTANQMNAAKEFLCHKDAADIIRMLDHPSDRIRRIGETFRQVTMFNIYESMIRENECSDILGNDHDY